MGKDAEVLVIGAGATGLGAARTLQDQGRRVLVLEGRNRIGGRVWTDRSLNSLPIDLGASWIHGTKNNPLTALAEQFHLRTLPTHYNNFQIFDEEGNRLTREGLSELESLFSPTFAQVKQLRSQLEKEDGWDISLQEAFQRVMRGREWTEREHLLLSYAINAIIEQEYATDTANLSLYYWDGAEETKGNDVIFPDGYGQMMDGLAAGLDIRCEQVVQKIEYHHHRGVTVTTPQQTFQAEYAIVTLPLGVLKKETVIFEPELPRRKQLAIQRLGMGVLNKLALRFPRAFWPTEPDFISQLSQGKGEWAEWLNLYKLTGEPLLMGFNVGSYGEALERMSDEEMVASAMSVLRNLFGNDIPSPEAWCATRWLSDPFAYGSYSSLPPGSSPADQEALSKPVKNRLFFAGEATSQKQFGTVHGAYLSGLREAQNILSL